MVEINILSPHLVNKIAAGEVIERPASVVKELVENAIDAGSSRVEITIEDGGKKLISVRDNGKGMGSGDLDLTFVPHATSKILIEDDLDRIATMGFRGEALASIASISHAHIRSKPAGKPEGYEVSASGEEIFPAKPCAAEMGTTVTIRDLFFNTPARRKFLRATSTELGHITEQLARIAIPNIETALKLTHNGRVIHDLPSAESTRQRIGDLFGSDLAESLLTLVPRTGPVGVTGLIGPPAAARGSGKWQYFFLNGRFIRDRVLSHALREAYRGLLDRSRWPVAFMFLEIDPSEVDVNVHPTKIEVRFRQSQSVHSAALAAMRETLNRADLTLGASIESTNDDTDISSDTTGQAGDTERQNSVREALADFFKSAAPQQAAKLAFTPGDARGNSGNSSNYRGDSTQRQTYHVAQTSIDTGANRADANIPGDAASEPFSPCSPASDVCAVESLPSIIQIHNSYIVAETSEGLVIVDQHALHERILYNQFTQRLALGDLPGQRLLIPETLDVTASEIAMLQSKVSLLKRLGIEVEPFGPSAIAIQQFTALLVARGVEGSGFLRELLDSLCEDETIDTERVLVKVLSILACKAAIKAGDSLSVDEMSDLLRQGENIDKGSSCPHGRPTTIKLTRDDLDKQFKRK